MFQPVTWSCGVKCPPATWRENISVNLARGLPEVGPQPPKTEPLFLCAAGPSLRDTAEECRGAKYIWALNGAHDYLLRLGIAPTHAVMQAPEWEIGRNFQVSSADTTYLVASSTHPPLVDQLLERGARVGLWHCHCPDEWGVEYGDRPTVFGGGTVGLRSLDLAWMVGFREIHALGFDACLSSDLRIGPDQPCWEDRLKDVRPFHLHGRTFMALPSHARQVEDLAATISPLTGLYITWYGDGLMQWAAQHMETQ